MSADMETTIRGVLAQHGRLPGPVEALADTDDLYQAGMTSHASVSVMLGLEEAFDIEFPDRMLTRDVFGTIASIRGALGELTAA
jgi:acyl carrier protein